VGEEALLKWREYDIPLQTKSKQRLPKKKKLNENMKIWFRQNHNKNCTRRSSSQMKRTRCSLQTKWQQKLHEKK